MKYNKDGKLIQQFGMESSKKEPGAFKEPVNIATDRLGNIYILDIGRSSIQKFDRDFKFLSEIKNEKGKPKIIDSPGGLCISPAGEIFISDSSEHKVFKLE
jgi:hypothetical protein